MLIIPPGFGQVSWRFTLTGDPEPIIFTMGVDLGDAAGDFQTACNRATNCFTTAWAVSDISNQYSFMGTTLRVGQDGAPPLIFETNPGAYTGTFTGAILPQNCAFLVRKLTASAGRRNRGRFYLPPFGVGEGSVDAKGVIDSSGVTNIQNRVNAFRTALISTATIELPPVILHSTGSLPTVPAPTPITAFTVDPIIATQRRRLRR